MIEGQEGADQGRSKLSNGAITHTTRDTFKR